MNSSGFGLYVTVKHRRKNGSGVREPVQCGIRKIHAVNVKLHEPSNSVEWPQLLKHLKKRPSGTRHDFVLVSSKSARLRWSLGQPLKLRTRLFTAGLLEEGKCSCLLGFPPRSVVSSPLRLLTKQNRARKISHLLPFLSSSTENPIQLSKTRFLPHIYLYF